MFRLGQHSGLGLLLLLLIVLVIGFRPNSAQSATDPNATTLFIPLLTTEPRFEYSLELRYEGFGFITDVTSASDDFRIFVVEKDGIITAQVPTGGREVFLDIGDRVRTTGERGLLGLAFHPDFGNNRFFYVAYTSIQGQFTIARYSVSAETLLADPTSAQVIFTLSDDSSIHNGGQIKFSPLDGKLYASTGDDEDPDKAQSLGSNKGKILRFAVGDGTLAPEPEVVALGLRNPWRFDIDGKDGAIFIGDVGFNQYEEVNLVEAGAEGSNFGWPCMRAFDIVSEEGICENHLRFIRPIHRYTHFGSPDSGCSITMGLVDYSRNDPNPRIVFSDYCEGDIRFMEKRQGEWQVRKLGQLPDDLFEITSFGRDSNGTILVATLKGTIYELRLP